MTQMHQLRVRQSVNQEPQDGSIVRPTPWPSRSAPARPPPLRPSRAHGHRLRCQTAQNCRDGDCLPGPARARAANRMTTEEKEQEFDASYWSKLLNALGVAILISEIGCGQPKAQGSYCQEHFDIELRLSHKRTHQLSII